MQERLTETGYSLMALRAEEFPEGTRPLFEHIMEQLDLKHGVGSQALTNAQADKLSGKIRELYRRVYWGDHPLWEDRGELTTPRMAAVPMLIRENQERQ
jgi:hypothetical protein